MKPQAEKILDLRNAAQWQAWLKAHHAQPDAVLLRIDKSGKTGAITYAQALDAALAWGWIDSRKQALDDEAWLQRFSKRKTQSPWSKINRAKAEALIAAGKMQAPGRAEVERARQDGRWERAYDGARRAAVPDDLAAALKRNRKASAFFERLDGTNRYAILYRVQAAKKPQTRAERIAKFVAMCAAHVTVHAVPRKPAARKA